MFLMSIVWFFNYLLQWCTNPKRQVARATKFCRLGPNICVSSVWNWLQITLLGLKILRSFLDFLKSCSNMIYDLFDKTVSSSVYTVSDKWRINWKGFRRKKLWHNLKHYTGVCLDWLQKTTKILKHFNRYLRQGLKFGHPKYKFGVVSTGKQRDVSYAGFIHATTNTT
jgi:hypothetical protein